jgi:hypothetical protein
MTRRVGVLAVLLLAVTAPACASTGGQSDAASAAHRPQIKHITVEYAKSYHSIFVLRADTKVAVIATAKSIALDPTTRRSLPPDSLVTMDVDKVLLGKPGVRITVYEAGGQPGEVVQGQVPIRVGHSYLMLLGVGPRLGQYFVLHGITGLFSYDSKTQVATRLDRSATWIPRTVGLSLAESFLGTPIASSPAPKPLAPLAGACPPGCSLPSDYDAITWLAAASNSVTIVTAYPNPHPTSDVPTLFKVDQTLEFTGAPGQPTIPEGPFNFPTLADGQQYLVFLSYWRGGPCVSTLYSYDPQDLSATLLRAGRTEIPLPGRELPVPQSLTLAQVRERMYPTGPFVQSTDASESRCPE